MLPLKLVRSLVLGEKTSINNPIHLSQNPNQSEDDDPSTKSRRRTRKNKALTNRSHKEEIEIKKSPLLLFLPTKELISDTYRLATIARDMGMDLHPTPSLSHIVFSYPHATSSSPPRSALSSSSSVSWVLPKDAVLITFPELTSSSLSHLRSFVSLSKGLFKLVFLRGGNGEKVESSNWDCCKISLFSRVTGNRIDSMEEFCRALTGAAWTLYKTNSQNSSGYCNCGVKPVYLFRKMDCGQVRARRGNGDCRIRELRLPTLDFRNAPLRILQYVVLMTDNVFYLA